MSARIPRMFQNLYWIMWVLNYATSVGRNPRLKCDGPRHCWSGWSLASHRGCSGSRSGLASGICGGQSGVGADFLRVLRLKMRRAAPQLKQLVAGFPPRRLGFELGSGKWDLWWTKWRRGRFSPSTSVSPAKTVHSINFSILTIAQI
jgi:hypothetical protein